MHEVGESLHCQCNGLVLFRGIRFVLFGAIGIRNDRICFKLVLVFVFGIISVSHTLVFSSRSCHPFCAIRFFLARFLLVSWLPFIFRTAFIACHPSLPGPLSCHPCSFLPCPFKVLPAWFKVLPVLPPRPSCLLLDFTVGLGSSFSSSIRVHVLKDVGESPINIHCKCKAWDSEEGCVSRGD